ncbi:MAG: DUF1816 domain-containing protein [Coleofasciculus sp. B1-GNL1-01]|uniref:DUF1816 domain-containing protein n=1 Tax=Coleofasciculus sp. B1-GNL1-01 TaxID=3068484 RepID=UPI0032FC3BA4
MNLKTELSLEILSKLGLAYWLEVITDHPWCVYYFGPFGTIQEAELSQFGYLQDILEESAHLMSVTIKQVCPQNLTLFEDSLD